MEEHLAIKLDSVTKEYPGIKALKNVNLSIRKGTIHGFLGPNGAGKSTTMKIISGLIPPTSGGVKVMGLNVQDSLKEVSSLIGFLPENPPLYKHMGVREFLEFVYQINCLDKNLMRSAVDRVLETCGLGIVQKRLIGHLSKGYRQRVGMAQALVYNPPILIFDEPTVGLDPQALEEIRQLIVSLKQDHTILLSTHLLHEASLICSDISIIKQGIVIKEGELKDIQSSFQTRQSISVEVMQWSRLIEEKLHTNFQVSDLQCQQEQGIFRLKISLAESSDQRSRLSQFLIEQDCQLLGLCKEQLDLETIFKYTTNSALTEVVQ